MQKKDRRILSVEEAAAVLGFHPESVRRLARRGQIPAVKFGARAWAFDSEVDSGVLVFVTEPDGEAFRVTLPPRWVPAKGLGDDKFLLTSSSL